jgi:hypothetical protein
MMYPPNVIEKAQEATLVMKVASLKLDLIAAEEELRKFRLRIGRRDAE